MKLQKPKVLTFWISVVLAILGVLAHLGIIAALASYGIWFVVVGFVLLLLGTLFSGL
jgi:predicted membrane channel-forming protein YqfA (hemolysin III family)